MSVVFRYDGALLPFQSVRLTGSQPGGVAGLPSSAWYGEAVFASITIDDPTGTLNFNGLHTFTVEETLCSKPRIFTGWITTRDVSRGPYINGAGRVWDCEIIDQNFIFHLQALRSTTDSVRPAETDVARAQAVITSGAMAATPIHDNGRFSTSGALSLSAANFVAQYADDVLNSTAGQSGKNYYAYWDDSADQISFHYDLVGTGPAATISVSNVLSDWNGTTVFAPSSDAVSHTDPADLDTGVLLMTAAGNVFGENASVIASLSPSEFSPVAFKRDVIIRSDRISRVATRDAFLQKYLTIHSVEKQTLTFTVQLPAAKVNLACAGDVMNVRFSHLPGFTTSTAVAIVKRTVVPTNDTDDFYDVHFECNSFAAALGPGGGSGGTLPAGSCTPQLVQSVEKFSATELDPPVLTQTPTPGNFLVLWSTLIGTTSQETNPDGFTGLGVDWVDDPSGTKNIRSRIFYRQVQSGDDATIDVTEVGSGGGHVYMCVAEFSGVSQFDLYDEYINNEDQVVPRAWGAGPVSPTVGRPVVIVAGIMPSLNVNDAFAPGEVTGATQLGVSGYDTSPFGNANPKAWFGYKAGPSAGTIPIIFTVTDTDGSGNSRAHAGLTAVFSSDPCNSEGIPPVTGQPIVDPVPPTTGSGTSTFTTDRPYASGSLMVFVDGILQVATEVDPEAGTYTLGFDPRPSERVDVRYQSA